MKTFYRLAVLALLITLPFSCQEKTKLVELDDTEIDSTRFDKLDAKFEPKDSLKGLTLSKGATWRTWRKLHRECMNAQWFKKPYYFGVSNTVSLGAIVDKEYGLERTMDATNGFTKEDLEQIINLGTFASCNYTQDLTISMGVFFQTEFDFRNTGNSDLDAELKVAVEESRSTSVKIDSWRINNLQESKLIDILEDAPDTEVQKKRFLKTLKTPGNKLLVQVVEIKGFTCRIVLRTEISADLKAKLTEGVVATMGQSGLDVNFKLVNERTIEVTSGGNFYVFGEFKKVEGI